MSKFGEIESAPTPGISVLFSVLGWAFLVVGVLVAVLSFGDSAEAAAVGFSLALSSVFLFAIGAVITRLHKIEYHLRPENRPSIMAEAK